MLLTCVIGTVLGAVAIVAAVFIPIRRRIEVGMVGLLLFSVFVSIGSAFLGYSEHRQFSDQYNWAETEAKILESRIHSEKDRVRPGTGGYKKTRSFVLRYEFEVDGVRYEGHRLQFGFRSNRKQDRAALLERFSKGSEVPVFYNPSNPSESVLIRGGSSGAWFFVIPAFLFGAVFFRTFMAFVRRFKLSKT